MAIELSGGKIGAITAYANGAWRDITKVHAGADLVWKKGEEEMQWIEINGLWWSAKNITINDGGHYILNYGAGGGLYYKHEAAIRVAASVAGARLPTTTDVANLIAYVESLGKIGANLKSLTGWNAPNVAAENFLGFDFKAEGYYAAYFDRIGTVGYMWCYESYYGLFGIYKRASFATLTIGPNYYLPVRLVRDTAP